MQTLFHFGKKQITACLHVDSIGRYVPLMKKCVGFSHYRVHRLPLSMRTIVGKGRMSVQFIISGF